MTSAFANGFPIRIKSTSPTGGRSNRRVMIFRSSGTQRGRHDGDADSRADGGEDTADLLGGAGDVPGPSGRFEGVDGQFTAQARGRVGDQRDWGARLKRRLFHSKPGEGVVLDHGAVLGTCHPLHEHQILSSNVGVRGRDEPIHHGSDWWPGNRRANDRKHRGTRRPPCRAARRGRRAGARGVGNRRRTGPPRSVDAHGGLPGPAAAVAGGAARGAGRGWS